MASNFSSFFFFLHCILFISQCCARDDSQVVKDPALLAFFKVEDLKVGHKTPIYIGLKNKREFLPKEKADSFPFKSKHLPRLLNTFSFSENSREAKQMTYTLTMCESKPSPGESKFCATSVESLIDSVGDILGSDAPIDVLATELSPKHTSVFQNFTVLEEPKVVDTYKQIGCHIMPYPYRVYLCHTKMRDHMLYKIPMVGDDGERIEAVGVCHAHKASKTLPEKHECHFMDPDDYFFVVRTTSV